MSARYRLLLAAVLLNAATGTALAADVIDENATTRVRLMECGVEVNPQDPRR